MLSVIGYAQLTTLATTKIWPRQGDTITISKDFVMQESLQVFGYEQQVDFVQVGNQLVWKTKTPTDSIEVTYKKLYFSVSYQHKNRNQIRNKIDDNPFKYIPSSGGAKTEYGTLKTAGNISRGIGFGNAQDVVVNSNLNLRLNGKLANDVEILAVISDENNPIQPEGNTQQIQDFDQVYITLKKDSSLLTLGDFLMKKPSNSYFINYYKKSRGMQLAHVQHTKGYRIGTTMEAAISRGRFSRNTIEGIEGNSGPYRLSGDNGELFIIIIAGTESVYLDGKKMARGENNDYVINYNTGEITFTPRVLITRYSRIVAEFQYSDRNYGRTVAHAGTDISNGRFTFYVNAFNEMDLKSQPFVQNINGFDSSINKSAEAILRTAGDGPAVFNNVRPQEAYNTERIMYTKSVVDGVDVYTYAPDPEAKEQFFEVYFSNTGFGNGSYTQRASGANGKVFEYVGKGSGDYEPVDVLIAPKRLNSINVGVKLTDKNVTKGIEYTLSNLDENTFSGLDDNDNSGFGLKVYRNSDKRLKDSTWSIKTDINYELVSQKYTYVERYRNVEFDRKWNKVLTNPSALSQLIPAYEHIANGSIHLQKSSNQYLHNDVAAFVRAGNFMGVSNLTKARFTWQKTTINATMELMQSSTTQADSSQLANTFYQYDILASRPVGPFIMGAGLNKERSSFSRDSLLSQSYDFMKYQAFIRNGDTSRLKYSVLAKQREDKLPVNEGFSTSTIGRDIRLESSYVSPKRNRIQLSTTYRQLQIKDTSLSNNPLENTLQSRLELNFSAFKKFVRLRTFYQIGTGQEQRREFQYLQVQAGNGVYIWNDYDSNNLRTLNEFEIASDLDRQRADYIKIYTPVAGFFTTNSSKMSQTLELSPAVFYRSQGINKSFFARFNSLTSFIMDKKVLPTTIVGFLNPFTNNLSDTSLINNSQNLRTTLFYNRGNSLYSMDYSHLQSASKILLTNGFDSRKSSQEVLNVRVNLSKIFTLNTRMVFGDKSYTSQFFTDRSYKYNFYEIQPKLQLVLKNTYRLELKTKLYKAANLEQYGGETSTNVEIGSDFKYTQVGKGTMNAGINYIKVNYNGKTGTTLGYELLRGLQNGNNTTWSLGYQRTLANNIQLVISYNGRNSEDAPVIHVGRLVARYLF